MDVPGPSAGSGATEPPLDPSGRYAVGAELSWAVVGIYVFFAFLLVIVLRGSTVSLYALYFILALLLFFLVRYVSTTYWMDADSLTAFRIAGGRRIQLKEVRSIRPATLRELSPTGFFGSWGYRGRMWSPLVGDFDSVQTSSNGILIYAGSVPLFITPRHPEDFLRELSRRVRSYRGSLDAGPGAPR